MEQSTNIGNKSTHLWQLIFDKYAKNIPWRKHSLFNIMVLKKLDFHIQKFETRHLSYTVYKMQPKMVQGSKLKTWNYPTTRGKYRANTAIYRPIVGKGFLDKTQKYSNKNKNRQTRLCQAEKLLRKRNSKMKRQTKEWEKIFENNTSDKGLTYRIHRKLKKLNNKINNPFNNGKRLWVHIFQSMKYK